MNTGAHQDNTIESPYFTTNEVAKFLKVHPLTIDRWRRAGKIPYHRMGYLYRYDRQEIIEWMNDKRQSTVKELTE